MKKGRMNPNGLNGYSLASLIYEKHLTRYLLFINFDDLLIFEFWGINEPLI